MRTPYYNKLLLLFLFLTGSLYFSSCVDKDVDLENISKDFLFKGHYEIPIGYSHVTARDVIKEYNNPDNTGVVIDSTSNRNPQLVALYYSETFIYGRDIENKKETKKAINGGFDHLKRTMQSVSFTIEVSGNKDKVQGNVFLAVIQALPTDPHVIKEVELENADVSITPIPGKTPKSITVGNNPTIPISTWDFNVPYIKIVDLDKAVIEFSSGASVPTEITITVKPKEYVVWGWFNYKDYEIIKIEPFDADIAKDLKDCRNLTFLDPQFEFDLENYDIGVPLVLNLRTISTNYDRADKKEATFAGAAGHPFDIAYPLKGQNFASGFYNINQDKSAEYNFNVDTYATLIHTGLQNVRALYDLKADEKKYNQGAMQFISSKGHIDVKVKAILPFWAQKGFLAYRHIEEGLDFEKDLKIEIGDDYEVDLTAGNVTLKIDYTNRLPVEVNVKADFIDANGKILFSKEPEKGKDGKNQFFLKPAVNKDGTVVIKEGDATKPYENSVYVKFTKSQYDDLKKAKTMELFLFSDDTKSNDEVVKIRVTDFVRVKVGAIIDGSAVMKKKENK